MNDAPSEIERLRRQLQDAHRELEKYRRGADLLSKIAGYTTYGPDIHGALQQWETAYASSPRKLPWRRIPLNESLAVLGAYLRRRALSGLLIAIFAAVPGIISAVLLWQQNSKIDLQIQLTGLSQAGQLQAPLAEIIGKLNAAGEKMCLDLSNVEIHQILTHLGGGEDTKIENIRCWKNDIFGKTNAAREKASSWALLYAKASLPFPIPAGYATEFIIGHQRRAASSTPLAPISNLKPEPPQALLAQATLFSNTLRPYRTLILPVEPTASPSLSREPVSPERGVLLQAFGTSQLWPQGVTFERAWAPGAYFQDAYWQGVDLTQAFMECSAISADFNRARVGGLRAAGVDFSESDLSQISFMGGADLRYAVFRAVKLPPPEKFLEVKIDHANFDGALAPEKGWYANLSKEQEDPYTYKEEIIREKTYYFMKHTTKPTTDMRASFCDKRRLDGFQL